jgi:alcohol dehydrogenase class IV
MVTINDYEIFMPTRILFGVGMSSKAGEILKDLGATKVLVVTDQGVVVAKLLENILPSLEKAGLRYAVFEGALPNAPLSKIHEGLEIQKKEASDYLLGIGGGSSIDTAKAIGCLATNPGPLQEYEGPEKYNIPPLPSLAIPTTAGTGTETSFGAVVFDEERQYKFSFRSFMQIPKVAILDPLLLKTTPPSLAAASGLDALAHCIEAYTSTWSTLITDAFCKQNFYLVGQYLRKFVADATDIEAASGMLQASTLGSLAFNTARVGLDHAMGHPLGTHFHLPHGVACGLLLPPVMRYNLMACPDRFIDIAMGLEGTIRGDLEMEMAYCAVEAIVRLVKDCDVHVDFNSFDITEDLLSIMADETLQSGLQLSNPRRANKEDVISIFKDLFKDVPIQ